MKVIKIKYNKQKLKQWFEENTNEKFDDLTEKEILIDILPAYLSWVKLEEESIEYEKNNSEEE